MKSGRPKEYFRAGAGAVVVDDGGRVLAFERLDGPGRWQLPQGGIEAGEAPVDAAYRELHEETGLSRDAVELVAEVPEWLAYELPPELRSAKTGRGQVQRWFVFRLLADPATFRLPDAGGTPPEFGAFKWMAMADLAAETVEFRRGVYAQLGEALRARFWQT